MQSESRIDVPGLKKIREEPVPFSVFIGGYGLTGKEKEENP